MRTLFSDSLAFHIVVYCLLDRWVELQRQRCTLRERKKFRQRKRDRETERQTDIKLETQDRKVCLGTRGEQTF